MRRFVILCLLVKFSYQEDVASLQCGGTFTRKQLSIQSPNYPEKYPSYLNCEYFLKGEGCPTEYNLQFLDFDLEYSARCGKDRLQIGRNEIICGRRAGMEKYFTEDGDLRLKFTSDRYGSGGGFNILVTRQPCLLNSNRTKREYQFSTQNCCEDVYDQKRFMITNPGFPHSRSTRFDCEYKIKRANDQICRLRLDFKFYSNGVQKNSSCYDAYLEIDNKRICGCRSGLKLVSSFDQTKGDGFKVIMYKNNGHSNGINGFAIEIYQDECPNKYEPGGRKSNHRYSSYLGAHKYFDYLVSPEVSKIFGDFEEEDAEESTYVDTSRYDPSFSNGNNGGKCRAFGFMDWIILAKRAWFENIPRCAVKQNRNKCIIFNSLSGQFQSVGYPFWYHNNLNRCYRFIQQPGYCSIEVHMIDFSLQSSYNCRKDYLLIENKYRYCGNALCNKVLSLEFDKPYVDFNFVTDYCYGGRGFKGTYKQQLCDNVTDDLTTTERTTITTEIITEAITEEDITATATEGTTTESMAEICGGVITDEKINLEVYGNQESSCRFLVYKLNSSVCTLNIGFLDFNLNCDNEYLLIDRQRYCGNFSGRNVSINFENSYMELLYQRNVFLGTNRRFSIRIVQNYSDCSADVEPPPS